jgi:hypothetical protein
MNAGCFFVFGNKGNTPVMATTAVAASDIPSLPGRLIKNMICLFDVDPEQTAMTLQETFPFGLAYPEALPRWTLRECAPKEKRA